jgi:mannose/fructose/N-acetylgalactosamine-specific phosphotransferase system component IIC
MIWSNELAVFFMLGFLLSSVVGMNTVQIVLLAVGLAVFYYSLLTNKTEPAAIETKTIETIDDGGDFFE